MSKPLYIYGGEKRVDCVLFPDHEVTVEYYYEDGVPYVESASIKDVEINIDDIFVLSKRRGHLKLRTILNEALQEKVPDL